MRRALSLGVAAVGSMLSVLTSSLVAGATESGAGSPQVSIASVSGDLGHAFVFAQVSDRFGAHAAPPGASPTPYYSRWLPIPSDSAMCPWLWAVYVYDRATNQQLNAPTQLVLPPGRPAPSFGTTMFVCPSPSVSPVAAPQLLMAQARLDLDLQTGVTPAAPRAGLRAAVWGRLTSATSSDLSLLLSMAIEEWHVDRWRVDLGDGAVLVEPGNGTPAIEASHVYDRDGVYSGRIRASIVGVGQAAEYSALGQPVVVRRSFIVEVSNTLNATVTGRPAVAYVRPLIVAAIQPSIGPLLGTPAGVGLRRIEVPRAIRVSLYLRPTMVREGYRTIGGTFAGWGQSSVLAWRCEGNRGQAPAEIDPGGAWLSPLDPLQMRWDHPDLLVGGIPTDAVVSLELRVAVRYPDGAVVIFELPGDIRVTVRFAAQNH